LSRKRFIVTVLGSEVQGSRFRAYDFFILLLLISVQTVARPIFGEMAIILLVITTT
jgi:hypothetical protein